MAFNRRFPDPAAADESTFYAEQYGILPDGVDHSLAFQTLLNSMTLGGEVRFGDGEYVFGSQITIPNNGVFTAPGALNQNIVIRGVGGLGSGQNTTTELGGTVLRWTTGPATGKVLTLGLGSLTITDLTISSDGASASGPAIYTTGTTLHIDRVGFFGRQSTPTLCDEDAIILGGASTDGAIDGDAGDPFQGYGTTITNCTMGRMRRLVYGRTYANAVVIHGNWCRTDCGGVAAIEFESSHTSEACTGNVIAFNNIEMVGYSHFFKGTKIVNTTFVNNNLWDFAYTALSSVSYNAGTNTLTKTGAFTNYSYTSGDTIYVASGTGVTAGYYTIASRVSNDAITLSSDPAAGTPSDLVCRLYVCKNSIYNLNTLATYTQITDSVFEARVPYISSGFLYERRSNSTESGATSQTNYPYKWESASVGAFMFNNTSGIGPSIKNINATTGQNHEFYQQIYGTSLPKITLQNNDINETTKNPIYVVSFGKVAAGRYGLRFEGNATGGSEQGSYLSGDIIGFRGLRLYSEGGSQLEFGSGYNEDLKIGAGSNKIGFNVAPITKPTVTGSRGANAALASLLTALANLGLLTDSSS